MLLSLAPVDYSGVTLQLLYSLSCAVGYGHAGVLLPYKVLCRRVNCRLTTCKLGTAFILYRLLPRCRYLSYLPVSDVYHVSSRFAWAASTYEVRRPIERSSSYLTTRRDSVHQRVTSIPTFLSNKYHRVHRSLPAHRLLLIPQ